jgi:hypothetical protein
MGYRTQFHIDSACIDDQTVQESRRAYRKSIYRTMLYYNQANTELEVMCIQSLWPQEDWREIWRNLHDVPVSAHHKATWYKVIHDIVRTNTRLQEICMVDTDKCRHCGNRDTLLHRFIVCGPGALICNWTATKIASIFSVR